MCPLGVGSRRYIFGTLRIVESTVWIARTRITPSTSGGCVEALDILNVLGWARVGSALLEEPFGIKEGGEEWVATIWDASFNFLSLDFS